MVTEGNKSQREPSRAWQNCIGEIAEVKEGDLEESGIVRMVVKGEIDGVLYSNEYIVCNAKVKSDDDVLGGCTKVWDAIEIEEVQDASNCNGGCE